MHSETDERRESTPTRDTSTELMEASFEFITPTHIGWDRQKSAADPQNSWERET